MNLAGSLVAVAMLVWLLRDRGLAAMSDVLVRLEPLTLSAIPPLILVNMGMRAVRWRVLLSECGNFRLWPIFSALMVGYLINNVLPARGGDIMRAWLLGNAAGIAKSRILATVLVERILDMSAVIVMVGIAASFIPFPLWIQKGGLVLAAGTVAALAFMLVLTSTSLRLVDAAMRPVHRISPWTGSRAQMMATEFVGGISSFRRPRVTFGFFGLTVLVWASEIAVAVLVGHAFRLSLSPVEGWILMLFTVFASFVPALPGQLGAFEVAVVSGLEFLGRQGAPALGFAVAWHLLLLISTSVIGVLCVIVNGHSLTHLPKS